ncbi:MAG: hypothetical protein IKB55_00475 [Clostridia bacterium]|nr:hypothetical protein [Clostridia bacterium]
MSRKQLNRKELYKNIILLFLILLSLVLFFRLWFGNWIWSYNSDPAGKSFFGLFDASSKSEPVSAEDIVMPKRLILTGGGKRSIFEKGTPSFDDCYKSLISLSSEIGLPGAKASPATKEEFESALKSQSVFLDFGSAYGKELLSFVSEDLPVTATDCILLTPGDAVIRKAIVYFKDSVSGEIYKITSEIPSTSIIEMIESHITAGAAQNIPFAFELGFDEAKPQETGEISHTILLDSYITIGLADETVKSIEASTPSLFTEITDNPSVSDKIVALFGFSPTSTRRYVEKDDVTAFVNKNGTIKFSKNGIIEYTAENEGIPITDSGANSAALGNIYSLIQNVMINCNAGEMQLHIASDLHGIANQNFSAVINIDYLINGTSVTIVDGEQVVHPITITIQNGCIVSYKQYVYKFTQSADSVNTSSMIKAVDLLYSQFENSASSVEVLDLYKSYVYNTDGTAQILWCAQLKDHGEINIIRE